jgi:hypothetical protein
MRRIRASVVIVLLLGCSHDPSGERQAACAGHGCVDASTCPSGDCAPITDGGSRSGDLAPAPGNGAPDADGGACGKYHGAEFDSCTTSADCACPMSCVEDPYLSPLVGSRVCANSCKTSDDCANFDTFCASGTCRLSPCGPNQGNAAAACTTGDGQPGSCVPAVSRANGFVAYWGCSIAGTNTGACSKVTLSRANKASICVAGDICDTDSGADYCVPLCVPNVTTCANGAACTAIDFSGRWGMCGP